MEQVWKCSYRLFPSAQANLTKWCRDSSISQYSPLRGSCPQRQKAGLESFENVSVPLYIWNLYQYTHLNILCSKEALNIIQPQGPKKMPLWVKKSCVWAKEEFCNNRCNPRRRFVGRSLQIQQHSHKPWNLFQHCYHECRVRLCIHYTQINAMITGLFWCSITDLLARVREEYLVYK